MLNRNDDEGREKVMDLINEVEYAQMVTHGPGGMMHSRPMVATQAGDDGMIWFMTRDGSRKVEELEADPRVLLVYSDGDEQNYVSLAGHAEVVRDRGKIVEQWSEPLRTWFPKGVDDPAIALLCVKPSVAEYWDAPSSTFVHVYGYLKSTLTGEPPRPGDIGHVDMKG